MQTDANELLESFKKKLPNEGTWFWAGKTGQDGTRARLLAAMAKMLRAGMKDAVVEDIITDLMFTGYVEHERQVKAKVGLSVREFLEQKVQPNTTVALVASEAKDEPVTQGS